MQTFEIKPYPAGLDRYGSFWNFLADEPLTSSGSRAAYDVLKTDEHEFRIDMALPGYTLEDLKIEVTGNHLLIRANKTPDPEDNQYLYRGIHKGQVERSFTLPEHVQVKHAKLTNGLLQIELVREIPEELMPRRIEIMTDEGTSKTLLTEAA